jgi:hypothetical protein
LTGKVASKLLKNLRISTAKKGKIIGTSNRCKSVAKILAFGANDENQNELYEVEEERMLLPIEDGTVEITTRALLVPIEDDGTVEITTRALQRAVESVSDLIEKESKGVQKNKYDILEKVSKKIGVSTKDKILINMANSLVSFCTIIWRFAMYGRIKNTLSVLLKAVISCSEFKNTEIADALGVSRKNKLLLKALDEAKTFTGKNCTLDELDHYLTPKPRARRIDAITPAEEKAASGY